MRACVGRLHRLSTGARGARNALISGSKVISVREVAGRKYKNTPQSTRRRPGIEAIAVIISRNKTHQRASFASRKRNRELKNIGIVEKKQGWREGKEVRKTLGKNRSTHL